MDKPITVIIEEFQGSLVSLVNDTPLPTFLKVQTVKELLSALSDLDRKEREQAKAAWLESQNAQDEEVENNDGHH